MISICKPEQDPTEVLCLIALKAIIYILSSTYLQPWNECILETWLQFIVNNYFLESYIDIFKDIIFNHLFYLKSIAFKKEANKNKSPVNLSICLRIFSLATVIKMIWCSMFAEQREPTTHVSGAGKGLLFIIVHKRMEKCMLALKFKGLEGALVTLSPLVANCETAYG